MNNKNQNRELTYSEAKALLAEMYARGDTEFAKETWQNKPTDEQKQRQNEPEQTKTKDNQNQ